MSESQMLELMKRSTIELLIITENALMCGGIRLQLEEDAEIALKRIIACKEELQKAQWETFDDQTALLKELREDIVALKAERMRMPDRNITMEEDAEQKGELKSNADIEEKLAILKMKQIAEELIEENEKDGETEEG